MLFTFAFSQVSFFSSCVEKRSGKYKPYSNRLTGDQLKILGIVQNILFPDDGDGPGAGDIHADRYLQWVITDPRMDKDEVEYIINGIGWVNETAQEDYDSDFVQLSGPDQEQLIAKISEESWGEDWLAVILNYLFEALLSDPVYGSNPDGIGWKWLDVYAGNPRPDRSLLYDEIFRTVNG